MIAKTILALLVAIRAVESSNGLDCRARGNEYQITSVCVADVNRIYGTRYRWPEDCRDNETARDIVTLYLTYYGQKYLERYHRLPTAEVLARIYHCGYRGYLRSDNRGFDYWRKIQKELKKTPTTKKKGN